MHTSGRAQEPRYGQHPKRKPLTIQSYGKHTANWARKLDQLHKTTDRLAEMHTDCETAHQDYTDSYNNANECIAAFFREIRDFVEREQEAALLKVKETYQ